MKMNCTVYDASVPGLGVLRCSVKGKRKPEWLLCDGIPIEWKPTGKSSSTHDPEWVQLYNNPGAREKALLYGRKGTFKPANRHNGYYIASKRGAAKSAGRT